MKKKFIMFLVLVGILVFSSFSLVYGGGPIRCVEDYSSMNPSYFLMIRTDKPIIRRGDTVRIDLYIGGNGKIEKPIKIQSFFPKGFADDQIPYGRIDYPKILGDTGGRLIPGMFELDTYFLEDTDGISSVMPKWFFVQPLLSDDCRSPYVWTEKNFVLEEGITAPASIFINISKKAKYGDHTLKFKLSYSDGKSWYKDEEEVQIRVKNPIEENRQLLFVMLTLITITFAGVSESTQKIYRSLMKSKIGQLIIVFFLIVLVWVISLVMRSLR